MGAETQLPGFHFFTNVIKFHNITVSFFIIHVTVRYPAPWLTIGAPDLVSEPEPLQQWP